MPATSHDPLPIAIFEKEHRFYYMVKELSILEIGVDLLKTYEKANRKKNQIVNQYKTANLELLIPSENILRPAKKKPWQTPLNLLILCLFLSVPMMTALRPLTRLMNKVSNLLELKPTDLIVKIGNRLEKMPEIEKNELKHAIHLMAREFREFTNLNEEIPSEIVSGPE